MEVVYFLRDYWQYISTGILVIFCVILMIIKKKPLTEIIDEGLVSKILSFIVEAEVLYGKGNGATKLSYVLGKIREIRPTDFEEYKSSYTDIVEYVLSCPSKKKESVNEKIK